MMFHDKKFGKLLKHFMTKRILITGASGYLAGNLINALKDMDCTIVSLSRKKQLLPINGKATFNHICGDITEPAIWNKVLENIDIVYHFAAQTSIYSADSNPSVDLNVNLIPMLNMLTACKKNKYRPIILFAGTATQAGLPKRIPVNESHPDVPISIYDIHKLTAESYLKYYASQGVVMGACLRLANVFGPGPQSGSADRGILNMMIRKSIEGEPLMIYGTGDYIRDYLYVTDVISAFLLAPMHINHLNGNHFVLGSGEGHTIKDLFYLVAERAAMKTGQHVSVTHVAPPSTLQPIEFRNFVADSRQFIEKTGWQATIPLIKGIDMTIEHLIEGFGV